MQIYARDAFAKSDPDKNYHFSRGWNERLSHPQAQANQILELLQDAHVSASEGRTERVHEKLGLAMQIVRQAMIADQYRLRSMGGR